MKTITGKEIKVTPNHSARTFTIRTSAGKFRTDKMHKDEFKSNLNNTANDWQSFLHYCDGNYHRVK